MESTRYPVTNTKEENMGDAADHDVERAGMTVGGKSDEDDERASERAMRETAAIESERGLGRLPRDTTNQPPENGDPEPTHADRLRELAEVLDNLPASLLPAGFNIQGKTLYVVAQTREDWLVKAQQLGAEITPGVLDAGVPPVRLRAGYWSITLIAAFAGQAPAIELDYQRG